MVIGVETPYVSVECLTYVVVLLYAVLTRLRLIVVWLLTPLWSPPQVSGNEQRIILFYVTSKHASHPNSKFFFSWFFSHWDGRCTHPDPNHVQIEKYFCSRIHFPNPELFYCSCTFWLHSLSIISTFHFLKVNAMLIDMFTIQFWIWMYLNKK